MQDFYTASLVLNHYNSISYYNRPFSSTDEMNECFIANINKYVKANDRLYIVGGYLFGALDVDKFVRTARYFRNKINCDNLFLVYGNHDRRGAKLDGFTSLFFRCADYMELKGPTDRSLILSHYPLFRWNRQHLGSFCLHGYCHGKLDYDIPGAQADVSVDNVNKLLGIDKPQVAEDYRPISFDELAKILTPKTSFKGFFHKQESNNG